ncbi:hypothetical protein ASG87_01865 [Frateuria sp. Soil773]|uniref:PilZ domain-containing protein n=1 Tax=Frateuria sp. Soil773 TaxID=1736407 RepID=UPI0006F7D06C|nr:PilZ domain-containing protein [Frateuria sp. Soil773]KRE90908.1 hypothetical protein ASG87_01865 [Frateuria sp. Soil773]
MATIGWDDFEQRLSCEDHWHADSEPLAWPVSDTLALRLAERNAATLASIAALEERRADGADDDNPVMQELQRLDAKLTALVDIVNRMVLPADQLPPRQWLRFNALGAVLPEALVPPDAPALLLRLRFDACRSLPLELPARVASRLGDGRVFVAFVSLGEDIAASLDRLVFRHHRRKVAVARQIAG